jgi:hypothetical protein
MEDESHESGNAVWLLVMEEGEKKQSQQKGTQAFLTELDF